MSDDRALSTSGKYAVDCRTANLDNVNFAERIITMIAVPYEEEAPVFYRGGIWKEVFSRTAFHGIEARLTEDHPRSIPATALLDVPAPPNDHSGARLIGRVTNVYSDRSEGLVLDVRISKTPHGDDTLELAADGAVSPSVGFMAGGSGQVLDRQTMTRRINRAFLDHVAFVGQPAYTGAQVLSVRQGGNLTTAALPELVTPNLDQIMCDPLIQEIAQRLAARQ